jgi:hypothetical protein
MGQPLSQRLSQQQRSRRNMQTLQAAAMHVLLLASGPSADRSLPAAW